MKKILVFSSILLTIFILLYLIQSKQLEQETELYNNQISSEKLERSIESGNSTYIYFYQTDCIHCKKVSPIIIPMADDLDIDLKQHDLQKNQGNWDKYNIEGTPTIIFFKDKKEVNRISGEQTKQKYEEWFKEQKQKE